MWASRDRRTALPPEAATSNSHLPTLWSTVDAAGSHASGHQMLAGSFHGQPGLNAEPPLPSQLPRHRSALHDAGDLTAKLGGDDRPPRDKGKLVALLDDGELAAR